MMNIQAFGLDWHVSRSPAFRYLLVEPLKKYCEIEINAWDGNNFDLGDLKNKKAPTIFCMLPPPRNLLEEPGLKVVWIPMWDQIRGFPDSWWENLPPSLRIVSFSKKITDKARIANLKTLNLRFFTNPDLASIAHFDKGRFLFYWNRIGLVSQQFLASLCYTLEIEKLYFRSKIDPRIPVGAFYQLPTRLGKTIVEEVPDVLPQDEYFALLNKFNLFISPRYHEGVGITSLEALGRGCVVFSANSATMNEYISHKETGYLLKSSFQTRLGSPVLNKIVPKIERLFAPNKDYPDYLIADHQDWTEIERLNLAEVGEKAHSQHVQGYQQWLLSLPDYSKFILDW